MVVRRDEPVFCGIMSASSLKSDEHMRLDGFLIEQYIKMGTS